MSVSRKDLVRYLEENGYRQLREGGNHSIFYNGKKMIPVKRHRDIDRITANEICKQAGLSKKF
jgi:mRNA interferase HicA